MKISKLFILLLSLMLFILSCGSKMSFDPRSYNRRNKTEWLEELPDGDGDYEIPSGSEDPFEKPENNNPNAGGFDSEVMKDWFITAKFLSGNIPEYQFLKSGKTWNIGDVSKNESYYYGDNTTALGNNVSSVKYYRYIGKNPTYSAAGGYNTGVHGKRMERFVFYKFTGKALGMVSLDNLLIAVDTYTKLVFAYGEPRDFDTVGNPGKWVALDNGTKYKFYEYDPVGIMSSDGSIALYEWFRDNQRNDRYNPDRYYLHDYPNVANASGPGKSPYFAENNEPATVIKVAAKNLKNKSVKSRDQEMIGNGGSPQNHGYFAYGIGVSSYEAGEINNVELLNHINNGNTMTMGSHINTIAKISIEDSINFDGSIVYSYEKIENKQVYVELSSVVHKYNRRNGTFGLGPYVDTARFGKDGTGTMTTKALPKVKLKYDKTSKKIVVDSVDEKNSDVSMISHCDTSFYVGVGEKKDFTIRYKYLKGNTANEEFEITYTISVEQKN